MKKNYASVANMEAWLRHPVLGDPSFDSFQRIGAPVHVSKPPYDWAVNGSLFCDFDGTWYCYAGLYQQGYLAHDPNLHSRFRIYRSTDKGASWQDLGWGMETGLCLEDHDVPNDSCPDVVLTWDERHKKYLLTYDTSTNDNTWEKAHDPRGHTADSGAGLAWADSPAGPFTRFKNLFLSNRRIFGSLGRWGRLYASSVYPRKNDYIAFCLADSNQHYAWALGVMTAPTPEGPWSDAHMVLSCDRPEYYPCPVEFHPVEVHDGVAVASATSVARGRNYQAVFAAPLEQATDPAAWKLTDDGSVWHAADTPQEYEGIWGQTYHGFVEKETGRYVVMFPSKNADDMGTINIAARPWDTPHTDGFTITTHGGAAVSPLLASYADFDLTAALAIKGQVDIAFDYQGILGPNDSVADSVPHADACKNYSALRLTADSAALVTVAADGVVTTHGSNKTDNPASLRLARKNGLVSAWVNGVPVCKDIPLPAAENAPLALVLAPRSRIDCTAFEVEGDPAPCTLHWNPVEGLLGAGQLHPTKDLVQPEADLAPDRWHRSAAGGYVGEGIIAAKWNLRGSAFAVKLAKGPGFGVAGIWLDGIFCGSVDLDGQGIAEYRLPAMMSDRRAVWVRPLRGRIGILGAEVTAEA